MGLDGLLVLALMFALLGTGMWIFMALLLTGMLALLLVQGFPLERVAFTVGRGETVGIVGESGSGKSVTALAILGILHPAARVTAGRAVFGGLDLLTAGEDKLREYRGRDVVLGFYCYDFGGI